MPGRQPARGLGGDERRLLGRVDGGGRRSPPDSASVRGRRDPRKRERPRGHGVSPQHRSRRDPGSGPARADCASHGPGGARHRGRVDLRAHAGGGPQRPVGPHLRKLFGGPRPGRRLRGPVRGRAAGRSRSGRRGGVRQALGGRWRHLRRRRSGRRAALTRGAGAAAHRALPGGDRGGGADRDGLPQQLERGEVPRTPGTAHRRAQGRTRIPGVRRLGLGCHRPVGRRLRRRHRTRCKRRDRHVHGAREMERIHRPPEVTRRERRRADRTDRRRGAPDSGGEVRIRPVRPAAAGGATLVGRLRVRIEGAPRGGPGCGPQVAGAAEERG